MADTGIRLTTVVEEPQHRGDHLAVVAPAVAEQLGAVDLLHGDPQFIRLGDPATGRHGYARLYEAARVDPGAIAVQGYILANAGVRAGDDVIIELWDPAGAAEPATAVTLDRIAGVPATTTRLAHDALVRLADSQLTFVTGHRFSLPLGGTEVTFQVVATEPAGVPVRCTPRTGLTVIGSAEPADTTGRPEPEHDVFAGIGGLDAAIRRITELVIWPAEHPELFARLGISSARGLILHGPPGTGKTLLARAVAQRLGAHFFLINGPEVVSKFYGEAEQRLRKVFNDAAKHQPSVVFIDELDSLAPARDQANGDLEVRLVSQLLTMMDGLDDRGAVVVLGATNRPSAIDPALRRPGRFDHEVEIGAPDQAGRRAILDVHSRAMPLAGDVDLDDVAERTVGFVGADLASLVQEGALAAARRTLRTVDDPAQLRAAEIRREDFAEGLRTVQPSAFRELRQPEPGPDWEAIVGLRAAKRSLLQLVDWPMSRHDRLAELGVGRPGGLLLCGAPLSGKTSLVAALARRLSATLIYLPAIELLSPWAGEAERMIRAAFVKARHTSPSIVLLDNLDALAVAGPDVVRRVLGQVHNELTQLAYTAASSVIVTARTGAPAPGITGDRLFSGVITLEPPSDEEVRGVVRRRLGPHLDPGVSVNELAAELRHQPVGEILRVCDEALTGALWDEPDRPVVRRAHLSAALGRLQSTRTTRNEEGDRGV